MKRISFLIVFLIIPLLLHAKDGDSPSKDKMVSSTFNGLKLRSIGPAATSGRISHLAVNPDDHDNFYVGVASGNLWKTTNGGITFSPIFDDQGVYAIGCVEINPHNNHEVWVGTGENNSQRAVGWGNGVHKSIDGGETWKNVGLKASGHIGRIVFHPDEPNTVWVAAYGWLWGPGGDRGVFKTTDGGETWENVLKISDDTGVSDLIIDPQNPNVLYAAAYQRRRHVWTLINGGPEGGLHKTTDGGTSWTKINGGFPTGDLGRIGIAISQQKPDVLYALVEAAEDKSGFFKSTNRGASWKRQSDYTSSSPQYYQEIVTDPVQHDLIYSLSTYTGVTSDGGKTWKNLSNKNRHVDDHALWINPDNNKNMMIGGDGGLYETYDQGETWRFFPNLPITQFYRIQADNDKPFYNVYGGTQDNNTVGGPSQTTHAYGILNQDWIYVIWGDGYEPQIDPEDPNTVYGQWQYGNLVRFDRKTGEFTGIKPQEEEGEELRWNWDTPLTISPHNNKRLYYAANKVFRSDDRGNSWKKISGDLTRQTKRNELEVMGKIWSPEAVSKNQSTSLYGNIVSLAESPVKEGLLWIGTDDGFVAYTEDDGENWTKISNIGGVPDRIYVADIYPSRHDAGTVYVIYNNHKMNDFKPYIFKSTNKGSSWTSITSGIPDNEPAWTIEEDTEDPNLLFVGTEFGLYFTNEGGKKWIELKGGFPTISVRDLDIQERETDLVVGTFGRGIYILDDYSPLRKAKEDAFSKEAFLFPVSDADMFLESTYSSRNNEGDDFYKGENPEFGAVFTYFIKDSYKTKKEERIAVWKETLDAKKTPKYPGWEEFTAEDTEEPPYLLFSISDATGNVIRELRSPVKTGVNRINWDLRYASHSPLNKNSDINKAVGMPVVPGQYQVTLSKVVDGKVTQLAGPEKFTAKPLIESELSIEEHKSLAFFQNKIVKIQGAVAATNLKLKHLREKMDLIDLTVKATGEADHKLIEEVYDIKQELLNIDRKLNGNTSISSRAGNQTPSVADRIGYIVMTMWYTSAMPTETNKQGYAIVDRQLSSILSDIQSIETARIAPIEAKLDAIKAPWTPGRTPVWK